MKKILFLTITTILVFGCKLDNEKIISKTLANLSTEKAINYQVEQITFQGNPSLKDTLEIIAYQDAIFQYNKDSLFPYKFHIIYDYVHPYYNFPINVNYFFNDEELIVRLESETENFQRNHGLGEFDQIRLNAITSGHIPAIVQILSNNGYRLTSQKDTLIEGHKLLRLEYLSDKNIPVELYLDKQDFHPVQLKVITNLFQPFIEEYHYSDFEYLKVFDEPRFISEESFESEQTPVLGIGDALPDWEFSYINGGKLQTSSLIGKPTVLYLSSLNCAPCLKASPYISRMYHSYTENDISQFVVFYPYDSKKQINKFIDVNDISYPITYNLQINNDIKFEIINHLKYPVPTLLLLDKNNRIIWTKTGFHPDLEGVIEDLITELNNADK